MIIFIFDGIHQNVPMNKTFIQRISDRHYGIGSDGMIVILPFFTL